jgi:hypothetical protein
MLAYLTYNLYSGLVLLLNVYVWSTRPSILNTTHTHGDNLERSNVGGGATTMGLVPLIPGMNVPWNHMPVMICSLIVAGVVHELGHAIAACSEKVCGEYI